ncbi:MAG: YybH family protein [Burkholderiaceae bacterium]
MTFQFVSHESAEAAEEAFYEALRQADLDALMSIWADDDDIVCIHPNGPRLIGQQEVRESWHSILGNGSIEVRAIQQHCTRSSRLAVHNLIEEVTVSGARGSQIMLCYATNIYVRDLHGWRLACHHASPASDDEAVEITHNGVLH